MRAGFGTDLHRLVTGRRLVLGGVTVPHSKGPAGHSDGDVVLHALTDALLGAVGAGDIGQLFPDTDPAYQDADSRRFVRQAVQRVEAAGYRLANADIVIQLERPKIAAYRAEIRQRIATMLRTDAGRINVKAKTNEGVDAIGRGEAVACQAFVLLEEAERRTGAGDARDDP